MPQLVARRRTAEICRDFGVATPGVDVRVHALSGGNQQKLVVGRELAARARALVAAHPTRGLDVAARAAVHAAIRRACAGGLAVVLVSADLEELLGLFDRVLVLLRGKVVASLEPGSVTPGELGCLMAGAGPVR